MDASFKLTRQEIGAAYDAGRDAIIALVEGLIERHEQRITAMEQELQELKKDSLATAAGHRRETASNASNRAARPRDGSAPASAQGVSRTILVRP